MSLKQKKILLRFLVFAIPLESAALQSNPNLFSLQTGLALLAALVAAGEKFWTLNQQEVEDAVLEDKPQ